MEPLVPAKPPHLIMAAGGRGGTSYAAASHAVYLLRCGYVTHLLQQISEAHLSL